MSFRFCSRLFWPKQGLSPMFFFVVELEKKVTEGTSTAEALYKALDAEATEHSTLQAIVTSVCDALEVGDSHSRSSLHSRVEALYT